MIYSYTLLIPMNQRVLSKQSKERNSLVHWYQQYVIVHYVPKCMSCHKAIVVITGRAHCFHGLHIYYAHLAFVRFEHFKCHGSLMTTYIYTYKYIYIYIYIYIYKCNMYVYIYVYIYIYIYIYIYR